MGDDAKVKEWAGRVISYHFGGDPFRLNVEGGGLNNHVVSVQHREGDFVVRIRPDDAGIGIYLKEKWATARARKAGVPAPEILEVACEAIPNAYMIARKSAGHPAAKRAHGLKIVHEMGRYAAIINSIPTRGFGSTFDWADENASRRSSWEDFLDRELKLEEKLDVLESNRMLNANARRKIRDVLESAACDSAPQRLNHGDLRMKNLLVGTDGTISAILDWENCASNIAPHWEFALALHDLNIDEKHAFLAGYGLSPEEFLAIAPVVKALNIVNYADKIKELARDHDEKLTEYRVRLGGAFDLYCL